MTDSRSDLEDELRAALVLLEQRTPQPQPYRAPASSPPGYRWRLPVIAAAVVLLVAVGVTTLSSVLDRHGTSPAVHSHGAARVTLVVKTVSLRTSLRGLFSAAELPPSLHAQCRAWVVTAPGNLGPNSFEIHLRADRADVAALQKAVRKQTPNATMTLFPAGVFSRPMSEFHTPTACNPHRR